MENQENFDLALQAVLLAEDSDDEDDDSIDGDGEERVPEQSFPMVDLEWWRRLGDPAFKQHFRMDRYIFEKLLVVGSYMVHNNYILRQGEHIDVALMMTLWVLATPDSFRSVGVKFGKSKGTVHNQYKTIIEVLRRLRDRYVRWPGELERRAISRNFEHQYGYPGVCGCIDGCHIKVTAPLEQPQRYFNYKRDYSFLLQAVCDDRLLFRDVVLGQPGAVGDRNTFNDSPFGHLLMTSTHVVDELHILGDGAYQLTDKLLIPYRNYSNLARRQRNHNFMLSRCRSSIERAFALLKGKWRRLKYFPNYCLVYALDHIMSCVVLHNFIILEGEECGGNELEGDVVPIEIFEQLLQEAEIRGHMKREYICAMLFPDE